MAYDKMSFESVDFAFTALFGAFHPDGMDDKEIPDRRFEALFDIFLEFAHWTREEYWEAVDEQREEDVCDSCKKEQAEEEEKKKNEVN